MKQNRVALTVAIVAGLSATNVTAQDSPSNPQSRASGAIALPDPKGMNKADLTEQLSVKSQRDAASGLATGVASSSKSPPDRKGTESRRPNKP